MNSPVNEVTILLVQTLDGATVMDHGPVHSLDVKVSFNLMRDVINVLYI